MGRIEHKTNTWKEESWQLIMMKNTPMRIGFIVNNYPPHLGGVERHVHDLATELAERKHEISVITLADKKASNPSPQHQQLLSDSSATKSAIRVLRFPRWLNVGDVFSLPTPVALGRIIRTVKHSHFDVISVHTRFFPLTWLGVLLGKRLNIPVLLTEHGSDFVINDSRFVTLVSKAVDYTFGRFALRHATHRLGVSPAVVKFVRRLAGVETKVFFNAVAPPDSRIKHHKPTKLVFVGRLVPGKGWKSFIDIAVTLKKDIPNLSAAIIGGGPDEQKVRAASPSWINVTGQIPHSAAVKELAGSTLVNPTILSEGFQTTVVEAVVNGGRVVGYPEPASSALQEAGAPVTIVERGNEDELLKATRETLLHPKPTLSLKAAEKWTWPWRADEFEKICQKLIADFPPKPRGVRRR